MSNEESVPKPIVSLDVITAADSRTSAIDSGESKGSVLGTRQIVSRPVCCRYSRRAERSHDVASVNGE